MNKTDDLQAWRIFCAVVEANGVNAACEKLCIEPSTASRTVKALEEEIGTQFFNRGTRPASLTEFGRQAYERASALLEQHRHIVQTLQEEKDAMSGLIRVAAIAGVSPREITPALVKYQSLYPAIRFALQDLQGPADDAFENAIATGLPVPDVAIGYAARSATRGLVARHLGEMPFVACASSTYLERYGTPTHPRELATHTGILLRTAVRRTTETLTRGNQQVPLVWGRVHVFSTSSSAVAAALLGGGVIPDLPLHHYLAAKASMPAGGPRLECILPGWHREPEACWLFCSESAWSKRRVRDFVEWMTEQERQYFASLREVCCVTL